MKPQALDQLRAVDTADVYKAGCFAGQLRRSGDDTVFRYAEDYLADSATAPLAFTVPKSHGEFRATGGSVLPFFAGLLPEGLRLTAVTAAMQTSEDDHLSLLLAVGADTIGDVQVVPAGSVPVDPPPMFASTETATTDFTEIFSQATSADMGRLDRAGLPGVQVKVSAQMISTPVTTARGPAILKLSPSKHPLMVENENFFLSLAGKCGIRVPAHHLATDSSGRTGLFVERFDRVVRRRHMRRLAQEDACQILGRYPSAKYRINLHEAIEGLAAAVEQLGGSRALAVTRMLEIAAFSYVVGNGDLHGKNLSIRQNPAGMWEVTPAYDLLCTQPYLRWRDPMALALYGRDSKLGYRWWAQAADRLNIPKRALDRGLTRIAKATTAHLDQVAEIGFDEKTTERLQTMIRDRIAEITPE